MVVAFAVAMVVGPVALVGMIILFYAVQNWSGKRAWEKCKQELTHKAVMDSPPVQPMSFPMI